MNYFLALALSITSIVTFSNEVVIQGTLKNFENREIRAYVIEDYITFNKSLLSSTPVENGKFRLEFNMDKVQQITLAVEDKSTVMFAEPGKVYNIKLSYSEEQNKGNIYDKFLGIDFPFPSMLGINTLIASFNSDYDKFFRKHYKKIFLNRAKNELQSFVDSIGKVDKYKHNDYVRSYVMYATANLLDISGIPSSELKEKYINGKKVEYNNPEYMNFFQQLFDERFRQFSISSEGAEMRKAIMLEKDLDKTLDIIKKGENISSNEIAELYLLHGLFEDYNVKTVDQESNFKMLETIIEHGKTEENRLIAKNLLNSLKLMKSGSKAPAFTLKNSKGNKISLDDFKGKYIYLNFWSSWSVPSLKELNVMRNIYDEYKDKVAFVSISLDDDIEQMQQILKENNYPWEFLHYGDDYQLKEKYKIKTVPSYFLIDKAGNFIESPAPGPLQIEERLSELN